MSKNASLKKMLIISISALFVATAIHATPYFSGYAGGGLAVKSQENSIKPAFLVDAFFSGQFDLSPSFIARTSASIYTTDSFFSGLMFKDKSAYFNLDELSLTYKSSNGYVSQFASVFIGEYDSIGSDTLLQRLFGEDPFGSILTETICGISKAQIYDNSGIGIAYYLKMPENTSLGLYGYYNAKNITTFTTNDDGETETTTDTDSSFNTDLRFAGAWSQIALDFSFGLNMPIEKSYIGEDGEEVKVVILIPRADLHMGLTAFFGSANSSSLLLQAGITKLIVDKNTLADQAALSLDNVFVLIEPKFVTKHLIFSVALFNMPENNLDTLYYVSNPTGFNLTMSSPYILVRGNRCQFGSMLTISSSNSLAYLIEVDSATSLLESLSANLIPFGKTKFTTGNLNYSLDINILDISSLKSFFQSMTARVSYRAYF